MRVAVIGCLYLFGLFCVIDDPRLGAGALLALTALLTLTTITGRTRK